MESLGLTQSKNSGSGWVEKCDGQSESIICELKSTNKESIRVKLEDLRKLEYHAGVSHKLPLFAIQFFESNDVWLAVKPEDLLTIANILGGKQAAERTVVSWVLGDYDDMPEEKFPREEFTIKSNQFARKQFQDEQEQKFQKTRKAK